MSKKGEKSGPPGSSPYPTQSAYNPNYGAGPAAPPPYSAMPPPPQMGYAGVQMPGGQVYGIPGNPGAPPAYGQAPGAAVYHPPPPGAGHPAYPTAAYPTAAYPPGSTTVVVNNGFDSGARFDGRNPPNLPPPPPGVMPNAAQMAAAQGHNVVVKQQKGGFLSGSGSGAGYSFW